MIRQFKHQDITWIDVSAPTQEELASLSRDYKLHSLVENELAFPSQRSRLDIYEDYLYLILHFPAFPGLPKTALTEGADDDTDEIDFIIEFFNLRQYVRYGIFDFIDNDLHLRKTFNLTLNKM